MTIDQFLERLTATEGPWENTPPRFHPLFKDKIRRETGGRYCCPITAMGTAKWPAQYPKDAIVLGLSAEDAEMIAVTADGWISHPSYSPTLRKKIEAATVNRFLKAA